MKSVLLPLALLASGAPLLEAQPILFGQEVKLTGVALASERFGAVVSLSGNTAAIKARDSVYVFVRSASVWTLQQRLTAADTTGVDSFASSVAISGDTLVVGAFTASLGSAHVFVRSGSTWTEQQKLTASDGAAFDSFGNYLAIDGDTIVVGAWGDDTTAGLETGSAYVFARSGTSWTEQQKLTASDATATDYFGWSVAVSGDTIAVGAHRAEGLGTHDGAVYVFVRSGTIWSQQQKVPGPAPGTFAVEFGTALSIDGDTLLVNARLESNPGFYGGAAYVFVRSGTVWIQQQRLVPAEASQFFGASVSLAGDTAVIGSSHHLAAPRNAGAAYVFGRTGSTWSLRQKLTAADRDVGDAFGRSVSLVGDTLMVGADLDDVVAPDEGSVYVFRTGTGYFALTPCRAVDTRLGGGPLTPGSTRSFTVAGVCQVPSDARAVAANLVAVNPGDVGDLRVYPTGLSGFIPSSINFAAGRTRANSGAISLGTGGQVSVFCNMPAGSTGTTHFVLDVSGYFR